LSMKGYLAVPYVIEAATIKSFNWFDATLSSHAVALGITQTASAL
jgi:hypothetical protein